MKKWSLLAAVLVIGTLAALPATAGSKGGASIWIDQSTLRTDGVLNYQDAVNFGYTKRETYSSIQLQCFQDWGFAEPTLVFSDSRPTWEGGMRYGVPFSLGPSAAWTGGDADCVAMLGHRNNGGKWMMDASINFHVFHVQA